MESSKYHALIIDDEKAICDSLAGVLSDEGWLVSYALSALEGIKIYQARRPDIVFLDVWMDGMDGIEALQKMRDLSVDIPIVVMSGHGNIETAVKVTKLGALDFLEKPLSLEKILPILEAAPGNSKKEQQTHLSLSEGQRFPLLGDSWTIVQLREQIEIVASRNVSVLITGENGTGKEVVARNIHFRSNRKQKPFVALNCAAIPEELIESELFGHIRGAFTNAVVGRRGKFEQADQGTIFLDEIGDMSLRTQAKILRILQEKQFERLGDERPIHIDVRVLAATNKNLQDEIDAGNFREDLFYRLNVVPFHLAPLRERGMDIMLLANYFSKMIANEIGGKAKCFSADAQRAMLAYQWPGNVRELRNLMERLSVMLKYDQVEVSDLPNVMDHSVSKIQGSSKIFSNTGLKEARADFERSYILEKLQDCQWNVSKTAEVIGLERTNLHRKLRALGIDTRSLKDD